MDAQGQHGPYEAALMDRHHLAIPDPPLELVRTIHGFDPCMACAVHLLGATGEKVVQVTIGGQPNRPVVRPPV